MCGIAGIAAWRADAPTREELTAMCDAMTHRGPDDAGYLVEAPIALGMRRLSIIDLATGHQPIYNEDGSVGVVCNGEIYNYRELRAELERAGHRFTTATDTEVIVHLWEEEGPDFAKRLNGMFAIALYDRRQSKLVLARDPVGIKPLYFALRPGELVFGSEIKAILASGRVPRRLDLDALGQFLAWEYVPGPATLFADIRKLGAGCCLALDLQSGQCSISDFWRLEDHAGAASHAAHSLETWAEQADAVIGAAVRRQMVADVPLGAFLSGGVDSSLVVAHMGRAHTFSIGFDDPTYNETQWSTRVAEHLSVEHTVEIIRPDVRELFGHLMEFMDDPIGDFSIFPTYLVSKLARANVKVVLSGDGGDELFGGYETFVANERARFWHRIPRMVRAGVIEPAAAALRPSAAKKGLVNKVKRFVEGAGLDPRLGHARWRIFATEQVRRRLFTPAAHGALATPVDAHILALAERAHALDARDRALYVDFKSYLVDNCLVKVDRMSMACSLEARVPLLDLGVVEFAAKLPSALKFRGGATKVLLKQVAARHVPRACIDRPKQGFSIPIKSWLKEEFAGLVDHYLDAGRLQREGIFDAATVGRLRAEHDSNQANHSHLLWGLLVFEHWRDRWGAA
jgi:asparagine synthase (glutamine-hydrolysing)